MQTTVPEWSPETETHLPWEVRLFILYLLIICVYVVLRSARLGLFLWRTRRVRSAESGSTELIQSAFRDCELVAINVASLNRTAVLAFLFSILIFLDGAIRISHAITLERYVEMAAWTGAAGEDLFMFALGLLVCTVTYSVSSFFHSRLDHRRIRVLQRDWPPARSE